MKVENVDFIELAKDFIDDKFDGTVKVYDTESEEMIDIDELTLSEIRDDGYRFVAFKVKEDKKENK
jgi:hypothetical protein